LVLVTIMGILSNSSKVKEDRGATKPQGTGSITYEDIVRVKERKEIKRLRSEKSLLNKLLLVILLIGPGMLVMLADNDAGGVITYAITGATYGISIFIPFLLLMIFVAYIVQEMTVRLGAVTHRGHAEMIFSRFGKGWGLFAMGDLVIANFLTMVTEFIGIGAGLLFIGVPLIYGVLISAGILLLISSIRRYLTIEKIILLFALFNLIYIPLVFLAHPTLSDMTKAFSFSGIPLGSSLTTFVFLIIANLGTTIAPWMLFYQQSAVVDKGSTKEDLFYGKLDTFAGAVMMGVVSVAIVMLTALTLHSSGVSILSYTDLEFASTISKVLGHYAGVLFSIGLFEAGFVAAFALSSSSAWAYGEVMNVPHSLNRKFGEAKAFYFIFFVSILGSAVVVLIPNAPLGFFTLLVQILSTILMPPALVFLYLLVNDRSLMGDKVNGAFTNVAVISIIIAIIAMNTILAILLVNGGKI
jgi:Mn2+/Fe2+ NRAMP family transporter